MPGLSSLAGSSLPGTGLDMPPKPVAMTVTRSSSSELLVKGGAHHEQRVGVRYLLDHVGGGLHLFQPHVHGPGDVDDDAPGTLDGCLQQGTVDGDAGGLFRLVLACGAPHAHMGQARVLHDGGDIGKVQVDEARGGDQIGNGLHRLAQHIVSNGKGVGKRDFLVRGILEPVVGDDDRKSPPFP